MIDETKNEITGIPSFPDYFIINIVKTQEKRPSYAVFLFGFKKQTYGQSMQIHRAT